MHLRAAARPALYLITLALISVLAPGSRASAQTLPDSALRPLLLVPATTSAEAASSPSASTSAGSPTVNPESLKLKLDKDVAAPLSPELSRSHTRRGAFMIAAGTTMAILGASLLAATAGTRCTESNERPELAMAMGGMLLGLGATFTLTGGFHLHHAGPPEVRRKNGGPGGHAVLGVLVGASASALPFMFGMLQAGICSSS